MSVSCSTYLMGTVSIFSVESHDLLDKIFLSHITGGQISNSVH